MSDPSDIFEIELVPEEDSVHRCCNTPPGVDPETNFIFSSEHGYVESVYWEKYAETIESVHERGCKNAALRNVRRALNNQSPANYIGTKTALVESIVSIKTDRGFRAGVDHAPEDGDKAHAHIRILVSTVEKNVKFSKNDRRELISLLCSKAFGALYAHSCECTVAKT